MADAPVGAGIRSFLLDLLRQLESPDLSEETIDHVVFRLEQISRHFFRIIVMCYPSEDTLIEAVGDCINMLSNYNSFSNSSSHVSAIESGARGRPKYRITLASIEFLLSLDISAKDIAKTLGVSRSTI